MTTSTNALLSAAQVAERLKVNVRTVQRRAADGEIPAIKLPGTTGSYVFREADFPIEVPA